MAWTQTDIDAIDAAILAIATSGAQTVTFSDGRTVTYYSLSELLKVRDLVKSSAGAGTIRCTYASFTKK